MVKKTVLRQRDIDMEMVKISAGMTPAQRLRWLEETRNFLLRAMPKSTLRAALKVREMGK